MTSELKITTVTLYSLEGLTKDTMKRLVDALESHISLLEEEAEQEQCTDLQSALREAIE